MEMFDVVDEDDNVIGQASREECHENGLTHRSTSVWVFNSKGGLLLQKRSKNVTRPGKLTISACGHVNSGESYDDAARRELKEELGIDVDIKFIHKGTLEFPIGDNGPGKPDIEHFQSYYCVHDGPFDFCKHELESVEFWSKEDLFRDEVEKPDLFTPGFHKEFKQMKTFLNEKMQ